MAELPTVAIRNGMYNLPPVFGSLGELRGQRFGAAFEKLSRNARFKWRDSALSIGPLQENDALGFAALCDLYAQLSRIYLEGQFSIEGNPRLLRSQLIEILRDIGH